MPPRTRPRSIHRRGDGPRQHPQLHPPQGGQQEARPHQRGRGGCAGRPAKKERGSGAKFHTPTIMWPFRTSLATLTDQPQSVGGGNLLLLLLLRLLLPHRPVRGHPGPETGGGPLVGAVSLPLPPPDLALDVLDLGGHQDLEEGHAQGAEVPDIDKLHVGGLQQGARRAAGGRERGKQAHILGPKLFFFLAVCLLKWQLCLISLEQRHLLNMMTRPAD